MFRQGETVEIVRGGIISPATIAKDLGRNVRVSVNEPYAEMRGAHPNNPPTVNREYVISRRQVLANGWDR